MLTVQETSLPMPRRRQSSFDARATKQRSHQPPPTWITPFIGRRATVDVQPFSIGWMNIIYATFVTLCDFKMSPGNAAVMWKCIFNPSHNKQWSAEWWTEIMTLLTNVLEWINPYAAAYKHLKEIEDQYNSQAARKNEAPPTVTIYCRTLNVREPLIFANFARWSWFAKIKGREIKSTPDYKG